MSRLIDTAASPFVAGHVLATTGDAVAVHGDDAHRLTDTGLATATSVRASSAPFRGATTSTEET